MQPTVGPRASAGRRGQFPATFGTACVSAHLRWTQCEPQANAGRPWRPSCPDWVLSGRVWLGTQAIAQLSWSG
eukprot:10771862-Lingulodinium_polyedra.AAC.1